jgi:ketosteroid isomerase-like protein
MSKENVELVKRLQPTPDEDLAAWFRDDNAAKGFIDASSPYFHADVEIVAPSGVEPSRYVGLAGLRDGWLDWLEPWASYRVEIEDLIDAGHDVVVLVRDFGRRPGLNHEISVAGAAIWTVRDHKVARIAFYLDRNEALEAAGLSSQDAVAES